MKKTKTLTKAQVNAISHNIIIGTVLQSAWDFVCNLAPTNEFEYAYLNSATEDYCDTSWHVTQNVMLHESLCYIDARDMYENATQLYSNFVDTNLANISVEEVYDTLDNISGDTAMRENYYCQLEEHFKKFTKDNVHFVLEETEYKGCHKLVSKHTYADKKQLVSDYLNRFNAYEYIELNNTMDIQYLN